MEELERSKSGTVNKINITDLVELIANETGESKRLTRNTLAGLQNVMYELLLSSDKDKNTEIRICEGIYIGTKFVPSNDRVDPRTGEPIVTTPRLKAYTRFTVDFKNMLKNYRDYKD